MRQNFITLPGTKRPTPKGRGPTPTDITTNI